MKSKKLMLALLASSSLASFAGCANQANLKVEAQEINVNDEYSFNSSYLDVKKLNETNPVFDYLTDAIKTWGKSMISKGMTSLIELGVNGLLSELGYDTRSIEQKKLDQIIDQLTELQNTVKQGLENIIRQQVKIRNQTIMDGLLSKVDEVSGPITSAVRTLNLISQRELSGMYPLKVLQEERRTFAKGVSELKFSSLTPNAIWYSTKMLATTIMKPSQTTSISLWDLYEDTYGAAETWDYLSIGPRRQFISYLAFLVNSMAELSKVAADYEISLLPEGDVNIETIKDGVVQMVNTVNLLNEQFQTKLLDLDAIEKKHDTDHIITHRDRAVTDMGEIVVSEGISVSTRLMPLTTNENEYNYITFDHDQGARYKDMGGGQYVYESYVYSLNSTAYLPLYETIFEEYRSYNAMLGYTNFTDFTIKDYLAVIGFNCLEEEYYQRAEGFYDCIGKISGSRSGGWLNDYSHMVVAYEDFKTMSTNFDIYSTVDTYKAWIWSDASYTSSRDLDHYYLAFLEPDQKTLLGDVTTTVITGYGGSRENSQIWKHHYRGEYKWGYDKGDKVIINS